MHSLYIFSLDGVLLDCKRDMCTSFNNVRSQYGCEPISLTEFKKLLLEHDKDQYLYYLTDGCIDSNHAAELYNQAYATHMFETTKLYMGVKDGFKKLHSVDHRLAVLSNKPTHIVHALLDRFGLSQYLYMIVGAGGDHPVKPDPEAIIALCHETEADITKTWLISDNEPDLKMAHHAGVKCAFAKYGHGSAGDETFDFKMMSFIDFEKFIDC